jgi:hypothetical protein
MTDAEKELRRMAQRQIGLKGGHYGHAGAAKLGEAVLALLDRIESLETEGERRRLALIQEQRYGNLLDQMFPTVITPEATTDTLIRGYGDAIEALQQGAANAERKGAEEMRESAAKQLEAAVYLGASDAEFAAGCVRGLPLPGDAP